MMETRSASPADPVNASAQLQASLLELHFKPLSMVFGGAVTTKDSTPLQGESVSKILLES